MKKLIGILLVVLTIFVFVGCSNETIEGGRFESLPYRENVCGYTLMYCRDKETDLIYICRGNGGFSVLYNTDGEPMTYIEFMEDLYYENE